MTDLLFAPPPPVVAPTSTGRGFPVRRLFCIGRNYAAHAREMGSDPDREPPFFFTKWAETVVPTGATVPYPPETADFQYESELVVAIGRGGRRIAADAALDHVWGYAAGLDLTRRDLQAEAKRLGRPWDAAKNVEGSAPLGLLHPIAEVGHPSRGSIRTAVDGATRQQGDLADMIWPVADIVAYVSRFYRLAAGDLIFTGTPAGVGPLAIGDAVVVSIAGLSDCAITIGEAADD